MEQDKVVHQGYLQIPTQGKIALKKTSNKYCLLYEQSKFGVDRLEIYDSIEGALKHSSTKIITLDNCIKITTVPPLSFIVVTKNSSHEFNALTPDDLHEWITAFQSVAFKDDVSKVTTVEEDNELYCSALQDTFRVKIAPSEASNRCNVVHEKFYTLILAMNSIQLYDEYAYYNTKARALFTWPYQYIRRYGYKSGKFTFVAGRKCESGEGEFHIIYQNHKQIFNSLITKMNTMKKRLSGESTTSLLDCGDNQLHAALIMEARSRSPLPPSPTSSTRIHDIDISASNSIKSMANEHFFEKFSERGPIPKPRPSKPPRKTLIPEPVPDDDDHDKEEYTSVDQKKYDTVEYKTDAWRQLGVNEPRHVESVLEDEIEDYCSWQTNQQPGTTTFTMTALTLSDNYDKLQFFGSTKSLNPQPGYKQVTPKTNTESSYAPSWNEYDEVEVGKPRMQSVRPADDSHLGYAVIRKAGNQMKLPETTNVDHKIYNDNAYAVVSKPKQV